MIWKFTLCQVKIKFIHGKPRNIQVARFSVERFQRSKILGFSPTDLFYSSDFYELFVSVSSKCFGYIC